MSDSGWELLALLIVGAFLLLGFLIWELQRGRGIPKSAPPCAKASETFQNASNRASSKKVRRRSKQKPPEEIRILSNQPYQSKPQGPFEASREHPEDELDGREGAALDPSSSSQALFNESTEHLVLEGGVGKACLALNHFYRILASSSNLVALELSFIPLEEKLKQGVIQRLAASLEQNSSVRFLNLKGNALKKESLELLIPYFSRSPKLEYLDLSCNYFGDEGLEVVMKSLNSNAHLQVFRCSGNRIGDDGMFFVSLFLETNSTLKSLYLCDNKIGFMGSVLLGKSLSKNNSLAELHLYGNELGPDGCAEITKGLVKNSSLRVLDVTKNNLSDQGAIHIAKLLASNRSLRSVSLAWNGVHRMGGYQLFLSLEKNYILRSLCTYWNSIGFQEVKIDRRIRRNRAIKTSAEIFCCIADFESRCHRGSFPDDLMRENPPVAHFFSIASRLPPEIQLTISGFMAGTRKLAPTSVISECRPPYGEPEIPMYYWKKGELPKTHTFGEL